MKRKAIDPEKLHYPAELADSIGLAANQINFLKKRGCPFFGNKTTLKWVRDFIAREAGVVQPDPSTAVYRKRSS